MKRIAIALFAAVIGFGTMVQDVEAKRLGGGKSSGISRDSSVMKRDAAPTAPAQGAASAAAAAPAKQGMSRWLGPLAGLAAGIGLAALLSNLGMGEGMANILMILALVMVGVFAFRWFMSRRQAAAGAQNGLQPAMQYSGGPASYDAARPVLPANSALPGGSSGTMNPAPNAATSSAASIPAGFDVEGFVRQAKLNFIRLQAANDRGDMDDLRQFCTPEMYAEIQMQYQERNRAAQETDVMQLNAELLDVSVETAHTLASVRFSGQIREDAKAAPEAIAEIWHLTRPADGSRGWSLAGIQQV